MQRITERTCAVCKWRRSTEHRYTIRCVQPDRLAAIETMHHGPNIICRSTDCCDRFELRVREYGLGDLFGFGKYQGNPVEAVVVHDPQYFEWVVKNCDMVKFSDDIWALYLGDGLDDWRSTTVAAE